MHVLYVIGGKGLRYGAEVVAENLVKGLKTQNDVEFTIVLNAKGVISELCEQLGIDYYIVKSRPYVYAKAKNYIVNYIKRSILFIRANFEDAIALRQLERKIDFSKVDIVHTNLSRNMLGIKIAKKYNIPHVWHIQEMFNAHYKLDFLMKNQIGYMNQNSDAFIGISKTVSDDWVSHGIDKEKCHTVLNGVEIIDKESKNVHEGFRLVMIAEITPPKGQEFVIDALSELSTKERTKFTLDFIGGGNKDYIENLKDKVRRNGLESRIRFLGMIENANKLLPQYDVLINASDGEGFGLSTAEAMMSSVCPLVSDKGANLELVENRITGMVYEHGNIDSFLDTLRDLLNFDTINNLSTNARQYAKRNFDVQRQVREIYLLYKSMVTRKEGAEF